MVVLSSNALVRARIQTIAMEMMTVIKTLGQIIAAQVLATEQVQIHHMMKKHAGNTTALLGVIMRAS